MFKSSMLVIKSCPFKEALDQRPYVGQGDTPLFHPQFVASLLWAEGHLRPSDGNVHSHSADYLFFSFKSLLVSLCCPALSSLSSFAWQKHVIFIVNVLDYYLVLVLKHYLVLRYYDLFWATESSALCISCQLSVRLIVKTEKAMWVDHSCFQGKSINWWISLFNFMKNIFSILWFT